LTHRIISFMNYSEVEYPMSQFDIIEASLKRLAARSDEMPLDATVLLRLIHHYSNDVTQRLRRTLKPHGLTEWTFRTLLMLQAAGKPGVPMSQLSHIAGETATNMTRICNELVEDGWACRTTDAADRRKVLLSILPKAEAALAKVTPSIWSRLDWGMAVLSPQEMAQMIRLMKRLVVRAEAELAENRLASVDRAAASKRNLQTSGGSKRGKRASQR
jgi:DNA-binding MarR family transcriptional regulator